MNGTFRNLAPAAFVMPFGKHKGTPIERIPGDYLRWLADEPGMKNNIRRHAARELQRRADVARAEDERLASALPMAPPCVVHGIELSAIEAGLFHEAVERGELVIDLSMPLASPIPEAWRRYCEFRDLDHAVREVGFTNDVDDVNGENTPARSHRIALQPRGRGW